MRAALALAALVAMSPVRATPPGGAGYSRQPSPGSVYPTLQQLEDEGLVQADEREGKKVFTLTGEGQATVSSQDQAPPWERFGSDAHDGLHSLRETGFQVGAAVMQVARAGSEAQLAKTKEILEEARRQIYQILAEDDQTE